METQSHPVVPAEQAYLVLREIRRALAALSSVHDLARWSRGIADDLDSDDSRALGRMAGHIDGHNGAAMERLEMAEHRLGRVIGPENVAEWDEQARTRWGLDD